MAKHPSAIKRHRQSVARRARNQQVKSRIRTLVKKTRSAIEGKEKELATTQLKEVNRALDKAVSKGMLSKNAASRSLARLARAIHRLPISG